MINIVVVLWLTLWLIYKLMVCENDLLITEYLTVIYQVDLFVLLYYNIGVK